MSLFLTILGLCTIVFGIYLLVKYFNRPIVGIFYLRSGQSNIEIEKTGNYSVEILAGKLIGTKNITIRIVGKNTREIRDSAKSLRFGIYSGQLTNEIYRFSVFAVGSISVFIENYSNIKAKKSNLFLRQIFTSEIAAEDLEILVRKAASFSILFLGLLIFILGILICVHGLK